MPAAKKKNEAPEVDPAQEAETGPSNEELKAHIAELEAKAKEVATELEAAKDDGPVTDAPAVECECYGSVEATPGTIVTLYGHNFEVQEDGRRVVGLIPAYDVANGTGAGRWKPVGMSEIDQQEAYWRMQHRVVIGSPPSARMRVPQMRAAIEEKLAPPTVGGKRIDHIRA